MTAERDVFARWSERRRAVAKAEAAAQEQPPVPEPDGVAAEETEDEAAWLAENGLPEPETLGLGDDFAAFMKAGVPAALKRRALRRLWVSNPVLANLDGLNDYDGDLRDIAASAAGITTDYQVGRGFMKRVVEAVTGDGEAADDGADGRREDAALAAATDPDGPSAADPSAALTGEAEPVAAPVDEARAVADTPARRRMTFRFEG